MTTTSEHIQVLHRLVREDDVGSLSAELSGYEDFTCYNDAGNSLLHTAALYDSVYSVRYLLRAGADIAVHDRFGNAPIHVAAFAGSLSVLCLLLDYGDKPDREAFTGFKPLHLAAAAGQAAVVKHLLSLDVNPDESVCIPFPPMREAIGVKKPDLSACLGLSGLFHPKLRENLTPLACAIRNAVPNVVTAIEADCGPVVRLADPQTKIRELSARRLSPLVYPDTAEALIKGEQTALSNAEQRWLTSQCHCDVVRVLLDAGVSLTPEGWGKTYVEEAIWNDNIQVLKMLFYADKELLEFATHDASPLLTVADASGCVRTSCRTPIGARYGKGSEQMFRYLLNQGATLPENVGAVMLHLATLVDAADIVRDEIRNGWAPNTPTETGMTPLEAAASRGASAAAQVLVEEGGLTPENGPDALELAASAGNAEIIELLLQNDVDPNVGTAKPRSEQSSAPDPDLKQYDPTPLVSAAFRGHAEAVRALLDGGADPDRRGDHGWPPLKATTFFEHPNPGGDYPRTVRLLIEGGAEFRNTFLGFVYSHWRSGTVFGVPLAPFYERAPEVIIEFLYAFKRHCGNMETAVEQISTHCLCDKTPDAIISIITCFPDKSIWPKASDDFIRRHKLKGRLFGAVAEGDGYLCQGLLMLGVDPNSVVQGKQPLDAVVHSGRLELIRLLLRYGATPSAESSIPDLDASLSRIAGDLLACAGIEVNRRYFRGKTILHNAILKASPEEVEALIELGADVNARNDRGETPLYQLFAYIGGLDTCLPEWRKAKLLIDAGADSRIKTEKGRSALEWALTEDTPGNQVPLSLVRPLLQSVKKFDPSFRLTEEQVQRLKERHSFWIIEGGPTKFEEDVRPFIGLDMGFEDDPNASLH